jgi:flagellar biosynthesis/type III secretory pathway protein FliH
MSSLIKSLDRVGHAEVRPLVRPAPLAAMPPQDEERERLCARIAQLETELSQRDLANAGLRADIDAARESGRSEGRAVGLREAEDRQAQRIALLEENLRSARAKLDESFTALERLAILVAQECLDAILGDPEYRMEALRAIVAKQLSQIEKKALLAIELSSADFPNTASLAAIKGEVKPHKVSVSANSGIGAGGCRMTFRLGRMDVGIGQQWGTLRTLLSEIADEKEMR